MSAAVSTTSPPDLPPDAPRPRLCRITKWPDFDGYGFHLQAIKSKPGQFIGKIDGNSPAEAAGLKQGDRIVEVNGVNINNENHVQVVERIKTNPRTVDLLVVDPKCYAFYDERKITVQSTWDVVLMLANEPRREEEEEAAPAPEAEELPPHRHTTAAIVTSSPSTSGATGSVSSSPVPSPSPNPSNASSSTVSSGRTSSRDEQRKPEADPVKVSTPPPKKAEESRAEVSPASASSSSSSRSGSVKQEESKDTRELVLEFDKLSAAEMRARLASRKRADPRQENLSAKQKHQIIQAL